MCNEFMHIPLFAYECVEVSPSVYVEGETRYYHPLPSLSQPQPPVAPMTSGVWYSAEEMVIRYCMVLVAPAST